ncbi:MAG: type II secretion system minor pseudopilin GspH [Steroidobacterales bacterium]
MRNGNARIRGFTLIEILVVIAIMAIVISLAVLSINVTGRDTQIDQESQRIEGLLEMLHDRALIEGHDFGMRLEPAAYAFVAYDTRRNLWVALDQDHEFRRRMLPIGLSFQLELDSRQVVLEPIDPNLSSDTAPPAPQLAIAASGDSTPFRITLLRAETQARAVISGDSLGKLTRRGSDQSNLPDKHS